MFREQFDGVVKSKHRAINHGVPNHKEINKILQTTNLKHIALTLHLPSQLLLPNQIPHLTLPIHANLNKTVIIRHQILPLLSSWIVAFLGAELFAVGGFEDLCQCHWH